MASNKPNPKVDWYFEKADKWGKEVEKLRKIILSTGLIEELKWGCPCYTADGANIVLIHDFKEYCAVLFFKGALLKDPEGILVQQTKNVQSARQARFTSVKEITEQKDQLKVLVKAAIEVEKSGMKVTFQKSEELEFPDEFQKKLDRDANLRKAFTALTPGRQRAYNLYFSAPKQAKTRESRVAKCIPMILDGRGLND